MFSIRRVATREVGLVECGLPKTLRGEQLLVQAQLRLGVQPAARVVQVDLAQAVEAGIVALAQLVDVVSFIERRIGLDEILILGHDKSSSDYGAPWAFTSARG